LKIAPAPASGLKSATRQHTRQRVFMRYALAYPKLISGSAFGTKMALSIRGWQPSHCSLLIVNCSFILGAFFASQKTGLCGAALRSGHGCAVSARPFGAAPLQSLARQEAALTLCVNVQFLQAAIPSLKRSRRPK
jgi:hypothetical protein